MELFALFGDVPLFLSFSFLQTGSLNTSHDHLGGEILINAILAALSSESTLLDASERNSNVADGSNIDANHAHLQCLGNAPASAVVLAEEVSRQANIGIVGKRNDLLLSVELEERSNRPEGLFTENLHLGRDVGQNSQVVKVGAQGQSLASMEQASALGDGILHVLVDLCHRSAVNQRAVCGLAVEAVADLECLDDVDDALDKLLVDAAVDKDAVGAYAGLASDSELASNQVLHCFIEVGVLEDDEGRVAAQFEGELLESGGALVHEDLANRG